MAAHLDEGRLSRGPGQLEHPESRRLLHTSKGAGGPQAPSVSSALIASRLLLPHKPHVGPGLHSREPLARSVHVAAGCHTHDDPVCGTKGAGAGARQGQSVLC